MKNVPRQGDNQLMGVALDRRSLRELLDASIGSIKGEGGKFLMACANPHSLVVARESQEFRRALESASAVVADGVGCAIGARIAGIDIGPRITGFDYFSGVMSALEKQGSGRVFFFGSSDSVLEVLRKKCREDYPSLSIEALSPPYGEWPVDLNREFIERINGFHPDVLWIAMTAPKQEKWMAINAQKLAVPVIGCIGAVFEYYAGIVNRAPRWICKLGLEWLYRLAGEPRRLWRRTVVSAPKFLWGVIQQRFGLSGIRSN